MLVRVVATGLCHTDLTVPTMLPQEMFPHVFGHEGAGVVEAVGDDVTGIEVGDHVVMSLRSCRVLRAVRRRRYGYCESSLFLNYMGMRLDGSTTLLPRRRARVRLVLRPVELLRSTPSRTPTTWSSSTASST